MALGNKITKGNYDSLQDGPVDFLVTEVVKPKPSFAPVYAAALYPKLVAIARSHGYALAAHGSLQRDFDLIGVPWTERPSDPWMVVDEICATFAVRLIGDMQVKEHGRKTWMLSVGHGECSIDLSFMPMSR